jgi:hypothetical protein
MKTTILWADAVLIDAHLGYDLLVISIRDSGGRVRRLHAEGYIAFSYTGTWDEMIITTARITEDSDFARSVWQSIQDRYRGSPPSTGSPTRNSATVWRTLDIEFADGTVMRCVASNFLEV